MGIRVVDEWSGHQAPMLLHAEGDVDAHLNQAGCCRPRSEARDRFPSDCILLIVQSKDDLGCVPEVFNWGVSWEDLIPNEEDEVHEGP